MIVVLLFLNEILQIVLLSHYSISLPHFNDGNFLNINIKFSSELKKNYGKVKNKKGADKVIILKRAKSVGKLKRFVRAEVSPLG